MPRPVVVPPTRRSRMPVRPVIHSSLVSSVVSRSTFVTIFSGRAVPQPAIRALAASTSAIVGRPLPYLRHLVVVVATGFRRFGVCDLDHANVRHFYCVLAPVVSGSGGWKLHTRG